MKLPANTKEETEPPGSEASAVASRRGRPRSRDTFTVSFRVDGAHLSALEEGAGELGLSVHEYARVLVFQGLDRSGETRIMEEVENTRRDVRVLRSELLDAVTLLMTNIVDDDPATVRAGVEKVLRGR